MATVEECRVALERLAEKMAGNVHEVRSRVDFDRPLACHIPDLGIAFHGRLRNGHLVDLSEGDDPKAKIKLTASSDDLVGLINGDVSFASAWASGRVKVDAGLMDLLKLRKLL